MTFVITGRVGGATFVFPSQEAFLAAVEWRERQSDAALMEYYAEHAFRSSEAPPAIWADGARRVRVADWEDVVMLVFARDNG